MTRGAQAAPPPRTVCLVALGCPKNLLDSERLLARMALAGYAPTTDPALADVIVVTTCAFLQSAIAECRATIGHMLRLKRRRPGVRLVVAGCLVQRLGRKVTREFPGADLYVGLDRFTDVPNLLASGAHYASSSPPRRTETHRDPRLLATPGHYAYLKIADGCDNRCAYCTIPAIRGPLRSRPVPDLAREAEQLAGLGVRELVLTAQDTTAYGLDIYRRPALARLLRRLGDIRGIGWLRLMYAHPAHLSDAVIRQFKDNPKLCRYLDLPVQHLSDRVLKAMSRRYRRRDVEAALARLRSVDGMCIRTTLMVGFPGETDAEFEELLEFVHAGSFDRLGAYAYSREPGTRAARLPGQLPEAVKADRLRRVMRAQAAVSRRRLSNLVGRRLTVLVDSPGTGRTEWDAPEVDGTVRITGAPASPGSFVSVVVTGSGTHDLRGRLAGRGYLRRRTR